MNMKPKFYFSQTFEEVTEETLKALQTQVTMLEGKIIRLEREIQKHEEELQKYGGRKNGI